MQSEIMPVQLFQLSPQLASIQTQLRTAIANHQMVFGNYQKDPKNAALRDKLQEMQVQIKNLSNHQTVIVEQLRGQLIQNAVASTGSVVSSAATSVAQGSTACSTNTTPVIVTPSCVAAVAKPVGQLSPQPQLLTLPHANVGIVVPFAHVQAQPTLMTLPAVLNQPNLQTPQSQPIVSLQLNASSTAPAAAILTPPTPVNTSVSAITAKQNQVSTAPAAVASGKPNQSVLRPIQPRPASPPIKVPHYTVNNHSSQGQQSGTLKGAEKSNGIIHRSFSESDAKDLKGNLEKDGHKTVEDKNLLAEKKKLEFMTCIGLVTHDASKAIQNKRVERKRRSTANPHYSYPFDSQKRRNGNFGSNNGTSSSWLMGGLPAKRAKGRSQRPSPSPADSCPGSPDSQDISALDGALSENKGAVCSECGKEGQLLLCGTCSLMYHLDCLSPPLASAPESPWSCPACIVSGKSNGMLNSGALSMVNSYITAKANKEDDKRKAQRKNVDLLQEKQNLLEKTNTLKPQIQSVKKKMEQLEESVQQKTASVAALKAFVKSIQDPSSPVPST